MSRRLLSRDLVAAGTETFGRALDAVPDHALGDATTLPGWTRAHVVAHVAANADALVNLATWARTGQETPMYSSPGQRDADIEAGSALPGAHLRAWFATSALALDDALAALAPEQWVHVVRTAQGRMVAATEIPWLRTREVMVHAVDLGAGIGFGDLPTEFVVEILDDATAKRSSAGDGRALELVPSSGPGFGRSWSVVGPGPALTVRGALSQLAAYVTGRPHEGLRADRGAVPELSRWL